MKLTDIETGPKAVAVLGFHDGSAGQIEPWFEEATGLKIACFVAEEFSCDVEAEKKKRPSKLLEFPENGRFKGRPFLVSKDWMPKLLERGIRKVLPLTPGNRERLRQIRLCRDNGIELVSAVHPSVTVLKDARIEPGVWIGTGAIIGYRTMIGPGVIIETAAQLDHHNVVEACVQIDPGVTTAGNVTLRECCTLHTRTAVINRIEVGHDAVVGAGAVVIRDVPPGTTSVGVPAKVIKTR